MLNQILTTDKLSLTRSSTADIAVHVSGADCNNSAPAAQVFTAFKENYAFSSAATGDICTVPATDHFKNAKFLSFRNKHASASNDLTVNYDANGTLTELFKCTLLAGELLTCREGVWFHFDTSGGVYGPSLPVASDTVAGAIEIASQAEMEADTSALLAVTPGRVHFAPGVAKFWVKFTGNSTTITASYNMTSITDGTTQATVTIATDFSSAEWCVQATAVAAAATAAGSRLASCLTMAAGTIIVFCVDGSATTAVVDPTSWCVSGFGDHT